MFAEWWPLWCQWNPTHDSWFLRGGQNREHEFNVWTLQAEGGRDVWGNVQKGDRAKPMGKCRSLPNGSWHVPRWMRQNFSGRVSFQIQKLGRSVKQNGNVYCRAKGYSNTRRSEKYFHFTIYFERQSGNIAVQVCIQVESRQTPVDDTHKSKREVYKGSSIST